MKRVLMFLVLVAGAQGILHPNCQASPSPTCFQCARELPNYYYNNATGDCEPTTCESIGFRGNDFFLSTAQEICQWHCEGDDTGPASICVENPFDDAQSTCRLASYAWYYDVSTRTCSYGMVSCHARRNLFGSQADCESFCQPQLIG